MARDKTDDITFKGITKKFFDGLASEGGKKLIDLGAFFATGGVSEAATFTEYLKLAKNK